MQSIFANSKKVLYELKQALRAQYRKIIEFLIYNGYIIPSINLNLFIKAQNQQIAVVLIYIDYLIITRNNEKEIQHVRKNLGVRFQMKKLGELKYFLGLEVERSSNGIFLCQHKYVKNLLYKFRLLDYKPISTPMEVNAKLCS